MDYASRTVVESRTHPGVRFVVRRMSLARRLALLERVRELAQPLEFLRAGQMRAEQAQAAELAHRVQQAYVEWGIESIEGLSIDGVEATPERLVSDGPEELSREAAEAVRRECGLSEEERKN